LPTDDANQSETVSPAGDVPEVSIVLPVYNSQRYLAETIESALSQTFTNFELVAVDDESTDDSSDILKRYADADSRVRILQRSHGGIVAARNEGMAAARGEFIAAMDHDDVMLPERLALQVAFLRAHPDCVAVGGAGLLIDPEGDPLIERHHPTEPDEIEAELFAGRNPIIQPCVMIRRESVAAIGGYREQCNFAEDYDLFLRLSDLGRLANLPQVLIQYRQHMSRASHGHYQEQNHVLVAALQEAYKRRGRSDFTAPTEFSWHPTTLSGFHVRCVNDALDGGNDRTARKHVLALFRTAPLSPRTYDLLARTYLDRRLYGVVSFFKSLLRPLKAIGIGRDRSS